LGRRRGGWIVLKAVVCLPMLPLRQRDAFGGQALPLAPTSTGPPLQRTVSTGAICGYFVLIGALNPCPCGWFGDPVKECTCSLAMVSRYQKRIPSFHSGQARAPLLDRSAQPPRGIDTRSASRCRASSMRSCRATGWASRPPPRVADGRVEAARERQARRCESSRLPARADTLAPARPPALTGGARGCRCGAGPPGCGISAPWTTRGRASCVRPHFVSGAQRAPG